MRKKTIAFCGDFTNNNGPANVNKKIRENSSFIFVDTKAKNKIKMFFMFLKTVFRSQVLIFSSIYRVNYYFFKVAKILNKKTIYLMHGCCCLDAKINNNKNADKFMKMENKMLNSIDLILPVSKTYSKIIGDIYPNYVDKISYLTNGIDKNNYIDNQKIKKKERNTVAVCGGNRIIKCNENVAKAIDLLNQNEEEYFLNIYGDFYDNNEPIEANNYIKIHGNISQKELYNELSHIKLFVLNSKYESFGLSVVDALMCGCNILISRNAGISDVIKLEENDIINDYNDIQEIKEKIEYNLLNDNNKRLIETIDFDYYSWKNVSKRLEKIATNL